MFESIEAVEATLAEHAYLADAGLATSLFLGLGMEKPLFLEGEPNSGRPGDRAKALSYRVVCVDPGGSDAVVPYVGLVASRKRGGAVLDLLESDGVLRADLARIKFPAGLDIGAKRGDEIAVSIICQMTVTVEGAPHTHQHEGKTYYFCCPGCRGRFAKSPEAFLTGAA